MTDTSTNAINTTINDLLAQVATNVRGHLLSALERHGDHAQGYIVVSRVDGTGGYWYSDATYQDFGTENAVIALGSLTANKIRRAPDASILENLLGYERAPGESATKCIGKAHALHLLQVWGGWIVDHGDCIWHTDGEGTAVDLVLPLVKEDRDLAEAVVRAPELEETNWIITRKRVKDWLASL